MFEHASITPHMPVVDFNGRHVGTVDELEGDTLKLTKSDSPDGQHHRILVDQVDRIEDDKVILRQGAPVPADAMTGGVDVGLSTTAADGAGSGGGISQDTSGGSATTGAGIGGTEGSRFGN